MKTVLLSLVLLMGTAAHAGGGSGWQPARNLFMGCQVSGVGIVNESDPIYGLPVGSSFKTNIGYRSVVIKSAGTDGIRDVLGSKSLGFEVSLGSEHVTQTPLRLLGSMHYLNGDFNVQIADPATGVSHTAELIYRLGEKESITIEFPANIHIESSNAKSTLVKIVTICKVTLH